MSSATMQHVDSKTVKVWLEHDECVLVDVREPSEHRAEHIAGATSAPLSQLDPTRVHAPKGKHLVLHCKSGMRSQKAAQQLLAGRHEPVWNMTGGIEAWKSAGLPVVRPQGKAPGLAHDVLRQTQLTIGVCVLAATVLALKVSPWFLIGTGFFGAGLMMAGLTGFCPLATVIAKMPWNQHTAPATTPTATTAKPCCTPAQPASPQGQ